MKKTSYVGLSVLAIAALVILGVQGALSNSFADEMTLTGTIVDSHCAAANAGNLESFVKTHSKECALMPDCEKSGYNIYSGGKLYKFDEADSKKVATFLKKGDSKLDVTVKGDVKGGEIKLISIENQK